MTIGFDKGFNRVGLANLDVLSISLNHSAILLGVQSLSQVMVLLARQLLSRKEVSVGGAGTRTNVDRGHA